MVKSCGLQHEHLLWFSFLYNYLVYRRKKNHCAFPSSLKTTWFVPLSDFPSVVSDENKSLLCALVLCLSCFVSCPVGRSEAVLLGRQLSWEQCSWLHPAHSLAVLGPHGARLCSSSSRRPHKAPSAPAACRSIQCRLDAELLLFSLQP